MPTYTAKDITVLEGLEPVRRRPGMYIGGVGSTGLHHLVWEILDNAVDEAMNGHASNIAVTLHKDGVVDHDSGRRPRDSGGQASADEDERARGDLHDAARRRQVRRAELQDRRRPARRRRVGRQRAVARAGRDRAARRLDVGAEVQAGRAGRAASRSSARRAAPARPCSSGPTRRSFRRPSSTPRSSASGSRSRATCTRASRSSSRTRRPRPGSRSARRSSTTRASATT